LVLDTFAMALWARDHAGLPVPAGELVHHSDAGSQYTSFAFSDLHRWVARLAAGC
jgi:putative transposase